MTEIEIKNFESIGHIKFAIDGFTVIIGKNNIGKSSVIRAISSALTNQQGSAFIRKGQKTTEVQIKRDKLNIHWKKGTSAVYDVNGESFSKLRGSVPPALIEAGFREIQIGDEKINPILAGQFEEIFLLDESGSFITETLSAIYKLDIIGTADDLCQKEIRASKTLLKTRESDIESLDIQLEKFKDLEEIKTQVKSLCIAEEQCEKLKVATEDILSFITRTKTHKENLERLTKALSAQIPDIKACENALQEFTWLEKTSLNLRATALKVKSLENVSGISIPDPASISALITEVTDLEQLADSLKRIAGRIKTQQQAIKILDSIPETQTEERLCSELEIICAFYNRLVEIAGTVKQTKVDLESSVKELETCQKELNQFKVCPLCSKPLNNDTIDIHSS